MLMSFCVFRVSRIEVSAYSDLIGSSKMHVQNMYLYDKDDNRIGDISIFLETPDAAMNVGDTSRLKLD